MLRDTVFNPLKLLHHADRLRALAEGRDVAPVTVEIDGKKTKETIKLKGLKGGARPQTSSSTTNGVVDPWAKKPKKP